MNWSFDPVLFSFGAFSVHWYGLIFAVAITVGFHLIKFMFLSENKGVQQLDKLFFYVVFGVLVGARLGHCLFYDPQYYIANPIKILAIWEGGLASHGGGIGAILGIYLFSIKNNESFIWLLDRIVIPALSFAVFVRCANFLNSEIVGAHTNVPWAVVFEKVDGIPRHPAQLYEAFAYLVIFGLLLTLYFKTQIKNYSGVLSGLFLIMVFSVRFLIEYIKAPQAYYSLGIDLNIGQLLSIPFLIIGILMIAHRWIVSVNKSPHYST